MSPARSKPSERDGSDDEAITVFSHPECMVVRGGRRRDGTGSFGSQETWGRSRGGNVEEATDLSADDSTGRDERRTDHVSQHGFLPLEIEG